MLTLGEARRAQSWALKIAETLLGREAPYTDVDHDRRWSGLGGFSVDRRDGVWYCFGAGQGGPSAAGLVRFLRPAYSWREALDWVLAFLAANPGEGECRAAVPDDDASEGRSLANAGWARHVLDHKVPIAGTDGEIFLKSRGLGPPYPCELYWYANDPYHVGDGAIVVELVAAGRTTGILLTGVDALGTKSLVDPARRRFNIEPGHPGAVMEIAATTPGTIDISADVIICEGLENGLSIARVKNPAWRIIALPGINALKHVMLQPHERRVIVFQDSDPKDHPARAGLDAGVDALIFADKDVRITEEDSKHRDANAILQTEGLGEKELRRLLAKPAGAALSFKGKVEELSKLPETAYMQARRETAKGLGVPVAYLDKEVTKRRPKPPEADDGSAEGLLSVPEDPAWTGPIPSLLLILDTVRNHFRRFVAITEEQLTAVVLWVAATHLIHSPNLDIDLFPKLAIESKDPASGKTTLLTLIWNCLPRAKLWTYPTGAYLVRALEQARFSLCLDELQYAEDKNLLRVINASQHRTMAYVPLLVPDHKGAYIPHEYFVWAPMALARLGEFSTAQQSRSIIIWMLPKLPGDKKEHLRRPLVPELADCRRQLAAWADSLTSWVDPELPASLNNRDVDNWIPLLFVAEQAGGQWPDLAVKAVEELMTTERRPTVNVRLLRSIWPIYQPDPDEEPTRFMPTSELLANLIGDEDEDWDTMGPAGRAITPEWLRERLRHLLDPPGSTRESRLGPRGYAFRQFKTAFARHLGTHPALDTPIIDTSPDGPGASGASGEKSEKTSEIKGDFAPGGKSHPAQPQKHPARADSDGAAPGAAPDEPPLKKHPAQGKAKDSAKDGDEVPVAPGAPGRSERVPSVCVPGAGEWGWVDGAAEQPSTTEPAKPLEKSEEEPRPPARARRAKKNSGEPAGGSKAPQFDLPDPAEPPLIDYIEGSIAEEVRQLHVANPNRSIAWIAKQSGQPWSIVREILGNGEDPQ